MPTLTDVAIKAAIARASRTKAQVQVRDDRCRGLLLRVSYGGAATFTFVYRVAGSRVPYKFKIGRWPDEFTLSDARDRADVLRGEVARGIDPREAKAEAVVVKRAKVEADAQRLTVNDIAEKFLAAKSKLRWAGRYRQLLSFNVLPAIGTKPASDVRARDINGIIDTIIQRGAHVQAARVFEVVRAMFRWAHKREYIPASPLAGVETPAKGDARERVLSAEEIRTFWTKLPDTDLPEAHRRVLKLQLLLGQRSGEISGIAKSEISRDGYVWTLPAARSKNGKEHIIPLPPLARSIIAEATDASGSGRYLFPGKRFDKDTAGKSSNRKPIRSDVLAKGVNDAQEVFKFTDRTGKEAPFTAHDLRRTVATSMRQLGISSDTVSAVLNHISETKAGVTARHYLHDDPTMEIRVALTTWQAALESILAGADPFAVRIADIDDLEARLLATPKAAVLIPLHKVQ